MASISNPQFKSGANFLQDIEPPDIPGLHFWMDTGSFSGSTWTDKSGNGRHATVTNTAAVTTSTSGNGSTISTAIYGSTSTTVTWPAGSIPSTGYTFFHVTRYTDYGTTALSNRIYNSTVGGAANWLSGHWNNVAGVAYHNNWIVSPQTNIHSGNWVLSTDQPSLYRSNGVTRGTSAAGSPNYGTGQLYINQNYAGYTEYSNFMTTEAIMYNRILTAQEYLMVEQYLSQKYGITLAATTPYIMGKDPYSEYVTLLARFDGDNGSSSPIDSSNLKSELGLMTNSTYTPTLTTGQLIKGSASGDFTSNNGSSAYGGFRAATSAGTKIGFPQIVDMSRDFTIEGWIYFNGSLPTTDRYWFNSDDSSNFNGVTAGNGIRIGKRSDHTLIWYFDNGTDVAGPTSGANARKFASANTWYHWAVVKRSNVMRTYIDGVHSTTTTSVGARTHNQSFYYLTLGNDYAKNGDSWYLDDVRVSNGVARYDANSFIVDRSSYWPVPSDQYWKYVVTLLRHDGTDIYDASEKRLSWTKSASNVLGGEYFSYDSGSGIRSSADRYATVASTSEFNFGTGDFCVDMWVNFTTLSSGSEQNLIDFRNSTSDTSPNIVFDTSNRPVYRTGTTSRITGTAIAATGWRHVALARVNGTTRLFVDGVLQGSAYTDGNDYAASPCTVFARNSDKTLGFGGAVSCLRITKGAGRYAAAFTHPSAPPPRG